MFVGHSILPIKQKYISPKPLQQCQFFPRKLIKCLVCQYSIIFDFRYLTRAISLFIEVLVTRSLGYLQDS